jgi:ribokinase
MIRFDVIGFGALNIDRLFKTNRIAGAEEESYIEAHEEQCGGSAANTCVGLARLGFKVGFIGKVGADREGNTLLKDFQKEGVDTNGVVCAKQYESGTVMGFVDRKGQRALYVESGANDNIIQEEINEQYSCTTKFLHITSFVGDRSFRAQKQLLKALQKDVKVSFDPGALYAQRGYSELSPIIERTYVMMPNEKELMQITGKADLVQGANHLLDKGVMIVAVKMGEKGCFVTNGQEQCFLEAFKVKTVDTTGAGDAFCAGFLCGLLREMSLIECGKIANFVASRKVMKMGARAGLPYSNDLKLLKNIVK